VAELIERIILTACQIFYGHPSQAVRDLGGRQAGSYQTLATRWSQLNLASCFTTTCCYHNKNTIGEIITLMF
jgi:hypothetical protein